MIRSGKAAMGPCAAWIRLRRVCRTRIVVLARPVAHAVLVLFAALAVFDAAGGLFLAPALAAELHAADPIPGEATATAPVLAVEDTIPVPYMTLPETLVESSRVTLDEIFRRVAVGEARRDSLMQDQSYKMLMRVAAGPKKGNDDKDRKVLEEGAVQVYKKRPNLQKQIPLRTTEKKDGLDIDISDDGDMSEAFLQAAFHPTMRGGYEFRIRERVITGGHVVYRIGFEPKSRHDPLPSGEVWVDTNDYVIIREEFWYRDRSPLPLWLESLDSCVLERTRIDGQYWVLSRVLARARFSGPVRMMARLAGESIPGVFDIVVQMTDWQINSGLPDSIFVTGASK